MAQESTRVPSVTLRRLGRETSVADFDALLNFWSGQSDSITLTNVEVEEQPGRSRSEMASQQQQIQYDFMDLDSAIGNNNTEPLSGATSALNFQFLPEEPPAQSNTDLPFSNGEDAMRQFEISHPRRGRVQPLQTRPSTRQSLLQRSQTSGRRRTLAPLLTFSPGRLPPATTRTLGACRSCLNPVENAHFLTCGHSYCRPCLNQLVSSGIANKLSWPPRCCRHWQGLDVDAIQNQLDEDVLIRYVSVREEYSTPNPVYCSNKICSRHIQQSRIQNSQGKFASCSDCDTETCPECKQGRDKHVGDDGTTCPSLEELMDEGDRKLVMSKRWKQCPGCKNLVERTGGCNYMLCQCSTAFCYRCGCKIDRTQPRSFSCSCAEFNFQDRPPEATTRQAEAYARRMAARIARGTEPYPTAEASATFNTQPLLPQQQPLNMPLWAPMGHDPSRHKNRYSSAANSRPDMLDRRRVGFSPSSIRAGYQPYDYHPSLAQAPATGNHNSNSRSRTQTGDTALIYFNAHSGFVPSDIATANPTGYQIGGVWAAGSQHQPPQAAPYMPPSIQGGFFNRNLDSGSATMTNSQTAPRDPHTSYQTENRTLVELHAARVEFLANAARGAGATQDRPGEQLVAAGSESSEGSEEL